MGMFRRFFGQSGDEPEETDLQKNMDYDKQEDVKVTADQSNAQVAQPAANADAKAVSDNNEEVAEGDDEDTVPVRDEDLQPVINQAVAADGATRKLPLETVIASRNAHLQFGQSTDVGMVRNTNQDAMLSLYFSNRSSDNRPDFGLFIVADGMGGHLDGERASAIVTRIVAKHVITNIFLPMMADSDNAVEHPPLTESLTEAIQTANADVLADVPDGGTTITAVAVVGDLAYFAHVGDSRAYLVKDGRIEQVTRDHSLVQRLIELDQLTPEEALEHPQQNVLYRAIGQSDTLEVDALTRRLTANAYLLLCSDGLWGLVDDNTILGVIRENPIPQNACDKLVAMANSMGGKDNITAVMLHVPS
jgi:PPM family protein phosphatase